MTSSSWVSSRLPGRSQADGGYRATPGFIECAFWRAYAVVYDGLLELTEYQRLVGQVTATADVRPGHSVVEVGCGTGNVLVSLARRGPAALTGIDSSPAMLVRARRKVRTDVHLVEGDLIVELGKWPAGSIDRLVAINVLYAVSNRSSFWAEAERVLAPDGFVIATQCDRPGSWPLAREQYAARGWRGLLHPRLLAVAMFDLTIDGFARNARFQFCSFETLAQEAAEAGLGAADYLGRCYGGAESGVNVLGRFRK
ncbi:MAG TPA: class I SAM-dependent methyltransferase [Dermatophilaceae bacterium]|nr:class I SAM-dependent methyltransferase [Dermatophilaceae bacterium]